MHEVCEQEICIDLYIGRRKTALDQRVAPAKAAAFESIAKFLPQLLTIGSKVNEKSGFGGLAQSHPQGTYRYI